MKRLQFNDNGSVLILVLWMLGLLTVFAVYLGIGVRQKLDFLNRLETRNKLSLIAEAGVKKAIAEIGNMDVERSVISLGEPIFNNEAVFSQSKIAEGWFTVGYNCRPDDFHAYGSVGDEKEMMFGVRDAAGNINLNFANRNELIRLLQSAAGVEAYMADQIASSIVDWRDRDSMSAPNGAEDNYYQGLKEPYDCKDDLFTTQEELCYVRGMTRGIFEKIEPYITVFGSGQVNINTAPKIVLNSLGLSNRLVTKILLFRCGEDKIPATADDRVFNSSSSVMAELSQMYSLTPSEAAELSNLVSQGRITVNSGVFLIQSTAFLERKNGKCKIDCVLEKNLVPETIRAGWILSWRIRYLNQEETYKLDNI
ncbi:MAG: hypothetical protein ABII88_01400 [Candidatus Omnitrophota bacterium]